MDCITKFAVILHTVLIQEVIGVAGGLKLCIGGHKRACETDESVRMATVFEPVLET